eukprot:1860133-Alexandrium_andersonii.AAC.1
MCAFRQPSVGCLVVVSGAPASVRSTPWNLNLRAHRRRECRAWESRAVRSSGDTASEACGGRGPGQGVLPTPPPSARISQ